MKGSVTPSKDEPPPSEAKAMSTTATRPARVSARGRLRGVRYWKVMGLFEVMFIGSRCAAVARG